MHSTSAPPGLTEAVRREIAALGLAADPRGPETVLLAARIENTPPSLRGDVPHALRGLDGTLRMLQLRVARPGLTAPMREAIQARCEASRDLEQATRKAAQA